MAEMTKEAIVAACKANGGYAAPHLNDQLYLHCKGFIRIQNLEPYVNAKVLWLEQNAISVLEGLEQQQELVSLFVQNNTIRSLRTLSTPLCNLRVLNISHNYITSLEGIAEACPQLETLQASHNHIASLAACEALWKLSKTLTSVDLSFNRIATYDAPLVATQALRHGEEAVTSVDDIRVVEMPDSDCQEGSTEWGGGSTALALPTNTAQRGDPLVLVRFFQKLLLVSVIYMHGNSINHGLRQYRRNMILHLPALTYLDERPVFDEERRVVQAWGRGGETAEAAERAVIRDEKRKHLNSCVQILTERMEGSREVRDRLTRQWEERREKEMVELTQRRREYKGIRSELEHKETVTREVLEKEEQDNVWDLMEVCEAGRAALLPQETEHRRAYEQAVDVQRVTEEAKREIAVEEARMEVEEKEIADKGLEASNSVLCELAKSDEDILLEMEEEIQSVLHSIDTTSHSGAAAIAAASSSATRQSAFDPRTARAERAVHSAVTQVAVKLRDDRKQRQQKREAVWSRFEQWERRMAAPPSQQS